MTGLAAEICGIPKNSSEIVPYVIREPEHMIKEILTSPVCYFYDSCTFRNHAKTDGSDIIFRYLKSTGGIVVLLWSVLMELCGTDGCIWQEHILFIKRMQEAGIAVLSPYEEEIFRVLSFCFSGAETLNERLKFAVRSGKTPVGTIEKMLERNQRLKRKLLGNGQVSDTFLAAEFFRTVRTCYRPGEHMGEEMIAVCIHLLSNIPDCRSYPYRVLTDDKGAAALLGRMMKNVKQHMGRKTAAVVSTPRLVQLMAESGAELEREEAEHILTAGNTGKVLHVLCVEKYELEPSVKAMEVQELARKIIEKDGTRILL